MHKPMKLLVDAERAGNSAKLLRIDQFGCDVAMVYAKLHWPSIRNFGCCFSFDQARRWLQTNNV